MATPTEAEIAVGEAIWEKVKHLPESQLYNALTQYSNLERLFVAWACISAHGNGERIGQFVYPKQTYAWIESLIGDCLSDKPSRTADDLFKASMQISNAGVSDLQWVAQNRGM